MRAVSPPTRARRATLTRHDSTQTEITVSYYGNDPAPVSIEPASEDVTDALEIVQAPDGVEDTDSSDLGDGLLRSTRLKI
jgi:hypothetical protein